MITPSGSASATVSPWNGESLAMLGPTSERLKEVSQRYFWHLEQADKHLSALDSLACSLAGEIENSVSTVILTASSERP
jgi:hypothetical protein